MKKLIEAALFIAGRRLSVRDLSTLVEAQNEDEVRAAVEELKIEYAQRNSPLEIIQEEGEYKMDVTPEYLDKVKNLAPHMDMSGALLKTLSHIAYKQPVKQSHLVEKFGNRVYEYVSDLQRRGLIRAQNRERTKILTTTEKLLTYLGEDDVKKIKEYLENARQTLRSKLKKDAKPVFQPKENLERKRDVSMEEWESHFNEKEQDELLDQLDLYEKKTTNSGKKHGKADLDSIDVLEDLMLKDAKKKKQTSRI